jgi:hypothetical protein
MTLLIENYPTGENLSSSTASVDRAHCPPGCSASRHGVRNASRSVRRSEASSKFIRRHAVSNRRARPAAERRHLRGTRRARRYVGSRVQTEVLQVLRLRRRASRPPDACAEASNAARQPPSVCRQSGSFCSSTRSTASRRQARITKQGLVFAGRLVCPGYSNTTGHPGSRSGAADGDVAK